MASIENKTIDLFKNIKFPSFVQFETENLAKCYSPQKTILAKPDVSSVVTRG